MRALAFREIYYNPASRFFEYMLGGGITKYLFSKGLVTKEELLRNTDFWLEQKIAEVTGVPFLMMMVSTFRNAKAHVCKTYEEARVLETKLWHNPRVVTVVDEFAPQSHANTHRFFVQRGKKIAPFAEIYPREAISVEDIMTFPKIVHVYEMNLDNMKVPYEKRQFLKEILLSAPINEKTCTV